MSGLTIFGRWSRNRLQALAVALLVVVSLLAALLEVGASVALSQTLDEHWPGAYDILVLPQGQDLGESGTDGFVEANFVSVSGSGGITLDQFARIRDLADVAVAAPIGLVGQIGYSAAAPLLNIPDAMDGPSVLPATPTLYRLTSTLRLTDATGTRIASVATQHRVMRRHGPDVMDSGVIGDGQTSSSYTPESGVLVVTLSELPDFTSSVIAVDPEAERALLGGAGDYLAPLADAPPAKGRTAKALGHSTWLAGLPDEFLAAVRRAQFAADDLAGGEALVVPLIVNDTPGATLQLDVDIAESDTKIEAMPTNVVEVQQISDGARYSSIGTDSKDLTSLLTPFATGDLNLPWPGTEVDSEDAQYTVAPPVIWPVLVGRPSYEAKSSPGGEQAPAFEVIPRGVVRIDGGSLTSDDEGVVAGVQSYRAPQRTEAVPNLLTPPLTLRRAGWTRRDRLRVSLVKTVSIGVPSLVIGVGLAAAVGVAADATVVAAVSALAAGCVLISLSVAADAGESRREEREG